MRLTSSARWGEPMVKRSGGADLSASRSLTADSVMNNSLTGASVTSLAFFCHGINALPAVYPDTYLTPPLHAHFCMPCISLNCSWPILVCRPKSEKGRKAAPETMRSSTATITRKRVFGPSVGLGVLLRRCATAASHIGLPSHADLALSARVEGVPVERDTWHAEMGM